MKTLFVFFLTFFLSLCAYTQENSIRKNTWTSWNVDTAYTHDGKMNVTKKRIKITGKECLVTEEIIFFHDKCGNLIRKAKIRSDCNRNVGEGNIVKERNYTSDCEK